MKPGQTIVLLDRLLREVKQTLQRQTAYVATERGHLTTLAELIKAGRIMPEPPGRSAKQLLHARGERTWPLPARLRRQPLHRPVPQPPPASDVAAAIAAGTPIVTIKFGRANVAYEHALYSALSQALAAKPTASFSVVALSGTGGDHKRRRPGRGKCDEIDGRNGRAGHAHVGHYGQRSGRHRR